jgi:hypothetical protein
MATATARGGVVATDCVGLGRYPYGLLVAACVGVLGSDQKTLFHTLSLHRTKAASPNDFNLLLHYLPVLHPPNLLDAIRLFSTMYFDPKLFLPFRDIKSI